MIEIIQKKSVYEFYEVHELRFFTFSVSEMNRIRPVENNVMEDNSDSFDITPNISSFVSESKHTL